MLENFLTSNTAYSYKFSNGTSISAGTIRDTNPCAEIILDRPREMILRPWTDPVVDFWSGIDKVIFNEPATIILWKDGTKTVVKAVDEPFDREKGFAMAVLKKMAGNKGNYFNKVKRWVKTDGE
jgi:hypothetical protein